MLGRLHLLGLARWCELGSAEMRTNQAHNTLRCARAALEGGSPLRGRRGDPNRRHRYGFTPLHRAVENFIPARRIGEHLHKGRGSRGGPAPSSCRRCQLRMPVCTSTWRTIGLMGTISPISSSSVFLRWFVCIYCQSI